MASPSQTEPSPNLKRFAQSSSARELSDALTALIKTKEIHAVRESDEFLAGLERLRQLAAARADAGSCLLAVATLQRARAVLKRQAGRVAEMLKGVLEGELPSLQLLNDAEERYYAASALELASGAWVAAFAARELNLESSSDNTAKALAIILLKLQRNVAEALEVMLAHSGTLPRDVAKPADSAARRSRRVLGALRNALRAQHFDPGTGVAKGLRAYLVAMLERHGAPEDPKAVRELVDATAGTIDDVIRNRLSLVVNSELYLVLGFVRRWAGPLWSGSLPKSAAIKALAANLLEGIRISARQGVTDQGLLEATELIFGSRDKALAATSKLADEDVGLPENVQSWLRRGRAVTDSGSNLATQSELLEADQYVAAALLAALDAKKSTPAPIEAVSEALKAVFELASARHLRQFGEVGSFVDYSRGSHTVISGVVDAGKVRIVRPGVERVNVGGIRTVVIKAIVETARGG